MAAPSDPISAVNTTNALLIIGKSAIIAPPSSIPSTTEPSSLKTRNLSILQSAAVKLNYIVNYDGKKGLSTKSAANTATRIAAIALPFIELICPQLKTAATVFTYSFQAAQVFGYAPKDATEEKKNSKELSYSTSVNKIAITIATFIGTFFACKVVIVGAGLVDVGLTAIALHQAFIDNGLAKESVIAVIKLAGKVVFVALLFFESEIIVIASIAVKLSEKAIIAYCEGSQGRLPECIAAIVLGALTNSGSINDAVDYYKGGSVTLLGSSSDILPGVKTPTEPDLLPGVSPPSSQENTSFFEDLMPKLEKMMDSLKQMPQLFKSLLDHLFNKGKLSVT